MIQLLAYLPTYGCLFPLVLHALNPPIMVVSQVLWNQEPPSPTPTLDISQDCRHGRRCSDSGLLRNFTHTTAHDTFNSVAGMRPVNFL